MSDGLGMDHDDLGHTLKDPRPSTSSMMDIDSQQLVGDGFGGSGFGRKFLFEIIIDELQIM